MACGGVGMDATLHGDPEDPRVAWLVNQVPGGRQRVEVAWPPGYRARFSPALEVLDGSGSVKLREGDHIDGACGTTKDGEVILGLSFGLER